MTSDISSPDIVRHSSPVTRHSIGVVAGEASGDLLGSLMIHSLQTAGLTADWYGIAGPKMQALGVRSLFPMEALSVSGYVEVLPKLRQILAIRRQLSSLLLKDRPKLFIGIDAPDFNLTLEARLKKRGIRTVHFVSPSIWAWRRKRINKIRRAASQVLLIFPFEEALYREAGIPATYVGHPLAYALPAKPDRSLARKRLGLDVDGIYFALLPGSRENELRRLSRLYLDTARLLYEECPDIRFLVPMASRETRDLMVRAIDEAGAGDLPIRIVFGHAHDVLEASDAALVASGTATLEAALLDCPHIITYKVPWLTYQIMKRQACLPWVGLPNILAGREVVPELLQKQATPENLAGKVLPLLRDASIRKVMSDAFDDIRFSLRRDTPALIAEAMMPLMQ